MTDIVRVDPHDTAAMDDWYDVRSAWMRAELPELPTLCPVDHNARLTVTWPDEDEQTLLARDAGTAVGYCSVTLPLADNRDLVNLELVVHPEHRNRGYGHALYDAVAALARELGRTRLVSDVPGDGPGDRFAARVGAQRKLVEMYRRLTLADVDEDEYDRLLTDAQEHADGYSLVQWRTTAPDEYLEDLAVLEGKLSTDVPFDDLAWEPEVYDAQRMRGREATVTGRGMRQFTTAVRHDASHQLVGTSTITLMSTMSEHAQQWETIVLEEHRGHRLGMLLKIENLRFARQHEPEMRVVDTQNADSNVAMLRVNDALGFRPIRPWSHWERVL